MTITIEISAEEEARLRDRARQQGQEVEEIARALVRAGLEAAPAEGAVTVRDAFLQHLLDRGDIPHIPQGRTGPPPRLVPVRGEPVSETIISERG